MFAFQRNVLRARSLVAVFVCGLCAMPAAAQQSGIVTGSVVFAAGDEPAEGAVVSVVSTSLQTVSDADGRFTLTGLAAGPHELVASFLGQTSDPVTVVVGSASGADVRLVLDQALPVEGVVVSASRSVKILRDVPASVSVVTPAELDRRASTVQGEELAGLSNVALRDNSAGIFTSIRIRGVPSSHQNNVVLALVDGVPFVTGGDEVDIERLVPSALVERIEVVKGPTSALYGRGGVAGAINYVTRPAFGRGSIETSLQAGSYGHLRPSATLSAPLGDNNQLLVSAFWEQKDGFVRGATRESVNVFLKDEWTLGPATHLSLYGNLFDGEQRAANHFPFDDGFTQLASIDERTNYQIPGAGDDRQVAFLSGRLQHTFAPGLLASAVVHARRHETLTILGFSDSFSSDQNAFFWNGFSSDETDETWFVEPQLQWDGGRVRVTAGASHEAKSGSEFNVWTGENGFPTPDFEFLFYVQKVSAETGEVLNGDRLVADTLSDYDYDGSVSAGYAQVEIDLSDRVTLGLGGRYDRFTRDLMVRRPVDGTPAETISDTEGHFSPKASLSARVSDDVTVYGSFGEGFNPAFGPPFVFSGRPTDLKPEIARNYEVGFKGAALDGDLSYALAAFNLERHDLLLTLFAEAGRTQSVNAGEHRSRGIEADLFARLTEGLTATGTYGYVDSKWIDNRFADAFNDEVIDWSGNEVEGVPAHTASVSLSQSWGATSVALWYDWRSDYWIDNDNSKRADGFGLLHGSVAFAHEALGGAELRLTGKNLLDEEYFYFFSGGFGGVEGYRGRPFELLAEVRYRW